MMDDSDIYDKILTAQKEFYLAITSVRDSMRDDAKEMRRELMENFQRAHEDNRRMLQELSTALRTTSEDLKQHAKYDDSRFQRCFWYIALGIGGLGGISLILSILNLLSNWKVRI